MNNIINFEENKDLSTFLEKTLQEIYKERIRSLAIITTSDEDDSIGIGYFNCSVATKILYAGYMQQDAMIATLKQMDLDASADMEEDLEEETADPDVTDT